MAKIELVDIAHAYTPGEYAVQDINLTWEDGIASALLGPSGCGKTTLLKIISGLLQPTQGRVLIDGKDVTHLSPRERDIAQVFQFPVVYETLSVYDNLAFPLRNMGMQRDLVKQRVENMAEMLGLTHVIKRKASQLGAAEKQRISLGRGLVREYTSAILFDEPLTVIDPHMKWHLRRQLKELQQKLQLTMVYVTHDQHEALTFADQVTVMNVGHAVQTGSPEDLHHRPAAPFVGYFIGSPGMNVFSAHLEDNNCIVAGNYRVRIPQDRADRAVGGVIKIGIRPEFVEVADEKTHPAAFHGEIIKMHLTGNAIIADIEGDKLNFMARLEENTKHEIGDNVWVTFPDKWTVVYVDEVAIAQDETEVVL